MPPLRDPAATLDRAVLLFLLGLFLLVSPLKAFWAAPSLPWYAVFLLWAVLIALAYWLQRRHRDEV